MSSKHILEVTETDFQYEVLAYSNNVPVLVDFWADWCQPCHMLTPILEKLTEEAGGTFRLAKVNADENPSLTMQFNIKGLPTVKAIFKGQVVADFVGAKSEVEVREFLRSLVPSEFDLALAKGQSMLSLNSWTKASLSFDKVLKSNPDSTEALLGLAKSQLALDNIEDALRILQNFPASPEYSAAEKLLVLADAMVEREFEEKDEDDDLSAAYFQALRLISLGNLSAAADGLLELLRQEKDYRDSQAKLVMIGIMELMGAENEEARKYRAELSSILF